MSEADVKGLCEPTEYVRADLYAALAEERDRLREALDLAAEDFRTIKTLNSHGASDQTYIGWLRSNAEQGERRARRALTGDTP